MSKGKKRGILIAAGIIAIIILISAIATTFYKSTQKKIALANDPEVQRSLNYEEVQPGDENVDNTPYVQFDAYFLRDLDGDGYAEKIRGSSRELGQTDTLYIDINVLTNGDLENGKLTINGKNINLSTAIVEDSVVKQNYISDNTSTIEFKTIHNGTQKLLTGTIKASNFGNDTTKYSQINSITLTGTHVTDDGATRTEINKEVDFTVDWHGSINASIYDKSKTQNIENVVDSEKKNVTLSFYVKMIENTNYYANLNDKEALILSKTYFEGTLPELNGVKPSKVETTSTGYDFAYDEETSKFTFTKQATTNESGIVTDGVSDSNTFRINVTYPVEDYESIINNEINLLVPVSGYYEAYNNPNSEFENPVKSNVVNTTLSFLWMHPEGNVALFDAKIGTYRSYDRNYVISKQEPLKLYNKTAEETNDTYTVRWYAYTGDEFASQSLQMKENTTPYTDQFLNNEAQYYNMSDYTKNIGIYFSNASNILGDDGYINVYNDETGELLHTFTKDDWSNYNSSNPYMYETPVQHIRIETSSANKNSSLYVYNIKQIDDNVLTTTFTRDEFDKFERVYTYLTGNIKKDNEENYTFINNATATAEYEEPISVATLSASRKVLGTQTQEKNVTLSISTTSDYYNIQKWTNGKFLIELPEQILDVEINDINISNSNVNILAYEIVDIDGKKCIKIETENSAETTYTINIDTNLTADPRIPTQTQNAKLYAYNEFCDNYKTSTQDIHDVNGNSVTDDQIGYDTESIELVSPTSLLTNQQATDYNEAKENAVAPQIASIDKTEADTATVNVSITNNYSGTISEVTILGKIPFEGNTFSINKTDLGSNFTTQMLSSGITVPDDLKDIAKVYYSEKEDPTNDLSDTNNGWTQTPDFSKVKSYLIDLSGYTLGADETKVFSYQIKVPATVQYNDVSYSTHAVYFCLDTPEGKFRTQTETSKLGFRIERKYNLSLTKTKENTQVPVQGATFTVTADGESTSKIGTTDNNGKFTLENLYVDKVYTLKEIRTPGAYDKNEMEVKFTVNVQGDALVLNIISGNENLLSSSVTQATDDSRGIANFAVENTPKYKIEITKKDQSDSSLIKGVKYLITGGNLGNGITATTNSEGKLTVTGLSQDVVYTLTETEAPGYYVNETPIQFRIVNNNGTLEFNVVSGSFATTPQITVGTATSGIDAQDTVTADLTDEKIPTYTVQLKKYAKGEDMLLPGAQYKVTGEGIDEDGATYTTDENGTLTIPNLYEYVEGKNITGVYTIQEIMPPEGYALNDTQLQFRAQRNGSGQLEIQIISGDEIIRQVNDADDIAVADSTITVGLEDEPLFKLTKVDATTKLPVAGAKFIIREINEDYEEIGYAKDINGNEVGTVEDGVPVVTTDENGEISTGLQSGLYKAIEIEAPEGYELPSNEADRTYYFGIGESKQQQTKFGVSNGSTVAGEGWNVVESVKATADKGYVATGYFYASADLDNDGNADLTGNEQDFSGFIAKYAEDGSLEFAQPVAQQSGEVKLAKVIQTSDGGYVAVGYFTGTTLTVGEVDTGLTNTTAYSKGLVIKLGSSGNYEWAKEIVQDGADVTADAVSETINRTIVVGANTNGNPQIVEYSSTGDVENTATIPEETFISDISAENSNQAVVVTEGLTDTTSGAIYTYSDGTADLGVSLDFNAKAVARLENGNAIVVGSYTGTAQSLASEGSYDGIIIEYDVNSNNINSANTKYIRGSSDDIASSVTTTSDGGYLVGGYTYSSSVDFNNDNANDITSISGNTDGFILKYSEDGTQEWFKQVSGSSMDEVTSVTERDEGEYVTSGYFNSSTVKGDKEDSSALTLSLDKYTDGFIFNYGEIVTAPEIPETSEITAENSLKQFKITTDVEEVNGEKGGTISGEDLQPYETVEYGKDSTKEIKMVPDQGYKIIKITINDEEYDFTPAEDGSVTLPQFTDVTTDKHIVVTFSNTVSSVLVHHYIDGTETPVADDDYIPGTIGEEYTTAPHIDLEEYELKKDENGNYEIPENASGTFTSEQQVVIYYYVKKQVPLVVHHYIQDTEEGVPLKDGTPAKDVTSTGEIGTEYSTNPIANDELSDEYELAETPENATGTYTKDGVEVTYYYKKVERPFVLTKYDEDGVTPLPGVTFEIASKETPDDIIGTYTTNENGQIQLTLEAGTYNVTETEAPENYELPENPTTEITVTRDTTTAEVKLNNTKKRGDVIVHYYIEGTTDKVPLEGGGTAQDVTKTGIVGEMYATKEADNVSNKYELIAIPDNSSGTITEGTTTVIYYYKLKDTSVLVHHYIEGTEEKVPAKEATGEGITSDGRVDDELISGKVDDPYTTSASDKIANNYELVETPANASGTMTVEQTVVTYYYKLKDPTIENPQITKDSGAEKVTAPTQKIPYTITYTATVKDYIGDATLTIVDELPYAIDTTNSDLNGGVYLEADPAHENKPTITWTENITGIDSYAEGGQSNINITKEIALTYKNLDVTQESVNNKVTGTLELKTPEKTDTVEDTEEIPAEYLKDVTVSKVWSDDNDSRGKRPTSVTLVLTADGVEAQKYTLTSADAKDGDLNTWEHIFTNLKKYNEEGQEIDYQLSEELSSEENNKFYVATIDQETKTVTNTFTVPDEKVEIPITKVWDDNDNANGRRPESVTLQVKNGSQIVDSHTVTESDGWAYTFTELPKYDNNGDEINYTIDEAELPSNNEFYIKNVDQQAHTITNKFTVPDDKINVTVVKAWDDNDNSAGKRPTSVTLQVKNGDEVVASQPVTEAEGWTHTFSVPRYDEHGQEITYTVGEADINSIFYTVENARIDQPTAQNGLTGTITNPFIVPDKTVDVTVNKVWDDNSDSAHKRPSSVTVKVTGNNDPQNTQSKEITAADNWQYTFTGLPKYDAKGDEITYTISEELDNIYYTAENSETVQPTTENGLAGTITNTFEVPDDKINIPVVKVWNDNNNSSGKRPESVLVKLEGNDGVTTRSMTLTAENGWTYKFTDLPKYNATNGDEIVYTVSEELRSIYYTAENSQTVQPSTENGLTGTITNTFKVPDDTIDIPVTKVWSDNGNSAGKRPASIVLTLQGNDGSEPRTVKINATNANLEDPNKWEYTFEDLPKYNATNGDEIVYTLSEQVDSKFYAITSTVQPTTQNGLTGSITNKFEVPDEGTRVTVNKQWNDAGHEDKRPASITLQVKGNGQTYEKEVTASDNWSYTFNDLPKYDANGDEIQYTVDEKPTNSEFYVKSLDQENHTVINTFKVPDDTVNVTVKKVWVDNNNANGKRPASVTLQVKNGDQVVTSQPVTADNAQDENTWTYTFKVAKYDENGNEINYTVDEADLNSTDATYYNKTSVDQATRTVTNTIKPADLVVHYYIEGTTDKVPLEQGGTAQDVTQNGTAGQKYTTTPAENVSNKYELVEMPENAQGELTEGTTTVIYYYRLKDTSVLVHHYIEGTEEKVPAKEATGEGITSDGRVDDELISGKVDDPYTTSASDKIANNYELVETPANASGTMTVEQTVVTYYYKLKDPTIENPQITKESSAEKVTAPTQKIPYTITYTATVKDYIGDATLTLVDELPYAIDTANSDLNGGVYLEADPAHENKPTITWTENITGIDSYAEGGQRDINITKEIALTYKNLDVTQKSVNNKVTGTLELKTPEKTDTVEDTEEIPTEYTKDITVNKVWVDNETQAQHRPASIIVVVKNGDSEVERQEINAEEDWTYTFKGLPKYDATGNEITYTVDEQEKQADDLHFYTKSVGAVTSDGTATITNTFNPNPGDTTEITINKVWVDNETQAARRPQNIVLQVKNGDEVVQSYTASSADQAGNSNTWSHTFTDLQKYNDNGEEIQYTVDETVVDGAEHKDDLKFYDKAVTEVADNQATIRNTYTTPNDTTSVTVNKVWVDNETQAQHRPESIVLQVKNGDQVVQSYTVSSADQAGNNNTWSHTFTDLQKYNDNGEEIQYTVDETVVDGENHKDDLKFYTKQVSSVQDGQATITNTFTNPGDTTELTVNKVWVDNETQAQHRPENIVLQVKNGNEVVQSYTASSADATGDGSTWSHTFTGLTKYDENGQEIKYTVDETVLEGAEHQDDLKFYTKTVDGTTITNTFKNPGDTTDVTVTKVWADSTNEAQKRPASIEIQLKNGDEVVGTQTISATQASTEDINTWEYTFTGLSKYDDNGQEIKYTADETEVNSGDLQFYDKNISGTTITNTFTQNTEETSVVVTKKFKDTQEQKARRPAGIKLILKRNGVNYKTQEISIDATKDEFVYTFENLPKYDEYNNIINYTVDEAVLDGANHADDLDFYEKTIDGTTITNTFEVPDEKISITVNKVWEDKDDAYGKRPLTLALLIKNKETGVEVLKRNITVSTESSATFTNLPKYDANGKEIEYTADEEEITEGDLFNYTKSVGEMQDVGTDSKQITITNTMTKLPGTVIVKYVDKTTGDEISDEVTKEGIVGEGFDVSEDKKDIPGYTLVEEPAQKTGTYTEKTQTKTYYYAKNTKVIVKYLEKGTNQVLTPEPQYEIDGYEGQSYVTEQKTIDGYTYIENTGNTTGLMTRDVITVIYYYSRNASVTTKYVDINTNEEISPEDVQTGYEGKDYTTTQRDIEGYTFVKDTDNTEGKMTKDPIEVIYYYAKNTKVIVKYLEQDSTPDDYTDNKVLAPDKEIDGYVGEDYTTTQESIPNYVCVDKTDNTEGKMTSDVITVIYYYAQNTGLKVQHIDKETGEILGETTETGKVGDVIHTHPEDFDGYVLVESPEEPDVTLTKDEQVVKYYYAHIAAGVIEKHIDDITDELLYSEEHKGNEGDEYNIPSKEFDGYDLVTTKLPTNAKGEMTREPIEVKYYYIKKASVRVEYIDKDTGEKLTEDEIINGHENDEYTTEQKDFKDYELVEVPENAEGTMKVTKNDDGTYNTETIVQYYYTKTSAGVLEKHIDINSGKVLYQETHKGKVGDEYDIPSKEFDGYELVTDRLPSNAKGTMTEDTIEVDYYYVKKAKVTVEYIDKQTGEKLDTDEIIGYEGDKYETKDKQFDGYDLVEIPTNKTGEMTDKDIVVKYYYARKSVVEVQFLEKGTNIQVAETDTINGYVGDKYKTNKKDVPYYKYVESTNNTSGTMAANKITVIYYYEKETFSMKVDKWIDNVTVDGIPQGGQSESTKDELYKVEIRRTKTSSADVRVTYTIRISNIGEIEGSVGLLTELIPSGFSYYQEDNDINWTNNDGVLTTDLKDDIIEPGKTKDIKITLRWNAADDNFGEKDNTAVLSEINNPAGYKDVNKDDNISKSQMLMTIATGLDKNDRILIIAIVQIVLVITIGLLLSYKKKNEQ